MTIHEVVTVLCKSGCKRGLFRDMTSNIVLEAENLVIWNWLTVKTETGRLERNKCQDNSSLLVNKENMQHWARTCKYFHSGNLKLSVPQSSQFFSSFTRTTYTTSEHILQKMEAIVVHSCFRYSWECLRRVSRTIEHLITYPWTH